LKIANIPLTILLLLPLIISAQIKESSIRNLWTIEAGYQNFRTFDKNVSPLIYVANAGALSFQFRKTKKKTLWDIGGNVSVGSNQTKRFGQRSAVAYDPYDITGNRDSTVYTINPGLSFVQAGLFYSYNWKLNTNKRMYTGGIVKDDLYYGALGADIWFFHQLSISPVYKVEILNTARSKIDAEISVPVFSYLLRQPYTLDPSLPENSYFKAYLRTGSSAATLNKFQQVNFSLKYFYELSSGDMIGVSYLFMWMNDANIPDRNLKAYSNSILISYSF